MFFHSYTYGYRYSIAYCISIGCSSPREIHKKDQMSHRSCPRVYYPKPIILRKRHTHRADSAVSLYSWWKALITSQLLCIQINRAMGAARERALLAKEGTVRTAVAKQPALNSQPATGSVVAKNIAETMAHKYLGTAESCFLSCLHNNVVLLFFPFKIVSSAKHSWGKIKKKKGRNLPYPPGNATDGVSWAQCHSPLLKILLASVVKWCREKVASKNSCRDRQSGSSAGLSFLGTDLGIKQRWQCRSQRSTSGTDSESALWEN